MPITFAGVPLTPPGFHGAELEQFWHRMIIDEFDHNAYLTSGVQHLPIPYPPKRRSPRLGCLYWPTGASRWATCHIVATGEQLGLVQQAIGAAPAVPTAQALTLWDGTTTITANMWLLPPRPIAQRGTGEFYLLTLVDDRWWWWQRGTYQTPTAAPASWADLFTELFIAVGASGATQEAVPAAYGVPSDRWVLGYQPLPLVLDAAAFTVGMRVVRQLDGGVNLESATYAGTADTLRYATVENLVLAGGLLEYSDIARAAPESVTTVFLPDPPDIVATANNTLVSLALGDYGSAVGVTGKSALVVADMPASAAGASRTAYATQAATDYYNWLMARSDYTLRAFQNVAVCGYDDFVEWYHGTDQIVTRVVRAVYSDWSIYGNPKVAQLPPGCGLKIDADGNIAADYAQWVGTAADTGLVVVDNPDPDCDNISVDLTVDDFLDVVVLESTDEYFYLGLLRFEKVEVTYRVYFNAAGIVIGFAEESRQTLTNDLDLCLFLDCCTATALVATIDTTPDPATGDAPLTVNFGSTVTGGVPPYTYAWVFPGGSPASSTAADPGDVEFANPGEYEVTLSVTDYCGNTVVATPVTVTSIGYVCVCYTITGENTAQICETVQGGSTDIADWSVDSSFAGGVWTVWFTDGTVSTTAFNAGTFLDSTELLSVTEDSCTGCGSGTVTYITPGSTEWIALCDTVVAQVYGAGGAGADTEGGGGGGGAFAEATINTLVIGNPYTAYVGAGGTASGGTGLDSYFIDGFTVLAKGGSGGSGVTGGSGGSGASSVGDVTYSGGDGHNGNPGTEGGGAGSSAGTAADGNDGAGSGGATAPSGGGDGGNGGTLVSAGTDGAQPGGGGGGGGVPPGAPEAHGNGANGKVVLTWG